MYTLLPKPNDFPTFETASVALAPIPSHFLNEAVFAGDCFWGLEAAFGCVDGVVKTATGYCGGSLRKPTYREVCEGRTGHTEAVKVIYDNRKVLYSCLCDVFWEIHDPTIKEFLNFGLSTHRRSAIFYSKEEERKEAQESKIRRQMKLNKRIVTKIMAFDSEFFMAENQHQKYYLQKNYRLCESLNLRSTKQFVESNIACKLNGILAMHEKLVIEQLTKFVESQGQELPKQTKLVCQELIEDLRSKEEDKAQIL